MSKDKKKKKDSGKFVEMDTSATNDMIITVNGTDGRIYRFTMPFNSPLPECYNASINVANHIAKLFNEAVEKQKKDIEEKEEKEVEVKN